MQKIKKTEEYLSLIQTEFNMELFAITIITYIYIYIKNSRNKIKLLISERYRLFNNIQEFKLNKGVTFCQK